MAVRFNSLQTGKRIQSFLMNIFSSLESGFQFPSNGKAYPKLVVFRTDQDEEAIMFQFPSNGKAYPKYSGEERPSGRDDQEFQFPSNGKAYPKGLWVIFLSANTFLFQFPSNGKAYPKNSFNSWL